MNPMLKAASAIALVLTTLPSFAKSELPCNKERYERGMAMLGKVSAGSGEAVIQSLADYAPFLACSIVEFAYGEVYTRPQLTPKQRSLATIAGLVAMGTAPAQLKVHINAGFNVGLTREEIMETIMHMMVYSGFPSAVNGIFALKEVEQERAAKTRAAK